MNLSVAQRLYLFSFVCLRIDFSFVGGGYCTNNVPCFFLTLIVFMVRFTLSCFLGITKPPIFFFLSLRTSSLLSSSWIASTTWWRSLSSCFLAYFPVSFVAISIWRSLGRSAFMYQDGSTMFLSTLFCYRTMSVLLFRASPQLNVVGPHSLQYLFIQHIVYRQGRCSSHVKVKVLPVTGHEGPEGE